MSDFAEDLYKQAIVLSELGQYQKVVSLLGPHVSTLHSSLPFLHALFKLKQYAELLQLSEKRGSEDAKYVGILQLRALSCLFLGNETSGLREIMTAVKIASNDDSVLFTYATIQCALGNLADAQRTIIRAISLAPENSWYHVIHAFICLERDQQKPAKAALEKAISLDPQNSEALYHLSLLKKNKSDKQQLLRRALQLDPNESRYQNEYHGVSDFIPRWLRPSEYLIHIRAPLKLILVCFCFLFALKNPALAQSISNLNDPVYLHHTLYMCTFGLIIRRLWLAELLLILCILLFSSPIVLYPQSGTAVVLILQIMASVLLLPLVKPMFFNLWKSCRDLWQDLRLLPANRGFLKSLYEFFEDRVVAVISANITLWFLVYKNYQILEYGVVLPLLLASLVILAMVTYVVLTNLLDDFDKPLKVLHEGIKQCVVLLIPVFATFIIYFVQLILFTQILNMPFVVNIAYPYLAAIVSFVVCASSIRFYFLAWHDAIPELYEMQPNKSSLS